MTLTLGNFDRHQSMAEMEGEDGSQSTLQTRLQNPNKVMEIPVYFSDEFSKYLHLFQFPNKSKDASIQGELTQKMLAK